jgi:hypothetical protein
MREQFPELDCQACAEVADKGQGEYPCPICPFQQVEPLFPENEEALALYGKLATGFSADFHALPMLVELHVPPDMDRARLFERLSRIHASMLIIAKNQK